MQRQPLPQRAAPKTETKTLESPERQQRERARLEEEHRQRRLAQEARERQRAEALAAEQQRRAEELKLRKLEEYKAELDSRFHETLTGMGYLPPEPSPLLWTRALELVSRQVQAHAHADPQFAAALRTAEHEIEERYALSYGYIEQLSKSVAATPSLKQAFGMMMGRVHKGIFKATVSALMPEVSPELKRRMTENELFLAGDWVEATSRGVLAVHVDEAGGRTILQIGIAEHGPVYITIPEILQPEDAALKSIRELIGRIAAFSGVVDPMAVIDGSHQGLNYNEVFPNTRVVRAPSGNTSRLALNVREAARRERLAADNTVILNSAPASQEEYVRVFKEDPAAASWGAWREEAREWDATVVANQFAPSPGVSQEAMVAALSQAKNVIVIVAHCDGDRIYMPEPPPAGSEVSGDYLLAHREQITANAPFVYLFSCEAGRLSNLRNFAATLLECGASGVIASQSEIGSAEGRALLGRILDEERGAPPLEDYFRAMRDVNYLDMEVFLA